MTAADRSGDARTTYAPRRAAMTGLGVAGAGIILFNVAPLLDWVTPDNGEESRTGYETDSLIPFIAYLGLGLLVALIYASKRALRGQHRGLSLVSMAVGLGATIHTVAFALNPMGGLERGDDLNTEIGVWVAVIGAAAWALGSGLLAKEPEGDDDVVAVDTVSGRTGTI